VYYHNTVTGEDSWHLPEPAPSQDDKGAYYDDEDNNNFFHSLTASSSGAFGVPSSRSVQTPDQSEDTFAPPAHKRELPANWVARLSDDGREWFYFNRVTGRTQREPPSWDLDEKMKRLSVGSTDLRSARSGRPRPRRSLELRRKTVEDWSKDTRAALEGLMVPPKAKNMSWHMETTQDALQKVLEAASLGINTEEDLGRARDLESAGGIESALLQQEDAVLSLRHAFKVFIAAIQTLYKAYGYVGPGEGIIEMPRPQWSSDLSIVGLVGRLGAVVHAATDSKYLPNEANSVWSEVIKVGGRLRDVLGSFPEKVSPNQPRTVQDGKMANRHELVLHTAGVGRIMADRWGFGDLPTEEDDQLRILDHSVLTDMRTLKDEYEALEYREDTVLQLVRLSTRFKAALLKIDVAEVVDVDGDLSDRTREDEARAYEELLVRVTNAVLDLEEYSAQIDELAMELIQKADLAPDVYGALRVSLDGSFSALESLLQLGTQQKALATSSGNIIAQIGHRSPRFVRRPSTRPLSMVSTTSRASRGSRPSITRGLDEELLEGELEAERRDRAGEMVSASGNASQTSLHQPQHQHQQSQHQHQHHGRRHASQGDVSAMSAASSTASLGYQHAESDGGSVRGKRTSLMNFMRGRSNTDDDGE
jgi:son of sevenless-like protein